MGRWGNPKDPKDLQAMQQATNVLEPQYGSGGKAPAEGGPG